MLVLAREAVRGVVLRRKPEVDINHNDLSRKQRNLHRTPFLISLFIIPLIIPIYLSNISSNLTSHPNFHLAFSLHISSILIEAYSETAYLRALEHGEVKTRVKAEGLGVICKALTTVGWLLCARKLYGESKVEEQALVAFGLGQLAWSICLVVVYAAAEMGRGEFGIGWWPFYEGVHVVKQQKTTNTIGSQ
jgi:oligosaccharide translocation protein RFT1